jgi:hypothetical protein
MANITVFSGLTDATGKRTATDWARIVKTLTDHKVGPRDGNLFTGCTFNGRRTRANVEARGLYCLDIEASKTTGEVPPPAEETAAMIAARGWVGVVYTTWNHTPEMPRYRVVIYPEREIAMAGDLDAIAADGAVTLGLAKMLSIDGVIDRTKLCAESMFYLPRHAEGRDYYVKHVDGEPVDGSTLAEAGRIGRQLLQDDEIFAEAAAMPPAAPGKSASVIETYNAGTSTAALLEQYGYKRKPRSLIDWRSPYQQSDSYATRVFPDGRFVTLSASDIAAGIGRPARGGAASFGDAFDLFTAYEHRGDQRAAIKAAAKALGLDAKKPADEWGEAPKGDGGDDGLGMGEKGADSATLTHPLARFVPPLPETLVQPKMILPGLIAAGLVVIAGQHGVGKTTVLASIVVKVAGAAAEGDPLAPRYGRHVVYVSEDTDQFQRIMYAVAKAVPGAADIIRERVHLVEAVRLPVEKVVEVASFYAEHFTAEVDGARLPPLVVLDTRSAIIAVDDENDNAETSKIMAALKQRFSGLPTWIVGHVAKASFGRADAKNMSARGATALEGDAHQVVFIVIEDNDERFLIRGKTRFEASVASCRLVSHVDQEWGVDEFGRPCEIPVRHVTIEPLTAEEEGDRKALGAEERKAAKARQEGEKLKAAEQTIIEWVISEANEGRRHLKSEVATRCKDAGFGTVKRKEIIGDLIDRNELEIVELDDGDRRGPNAGGYVRRKDWAARNIAGQFAQPEEADE